MRIGIDFRFASHHKGGMAVYALNLLRELKRLDKKNDYIALTDKPLVGWTGNRKLQWVIGEHYWLQFKLPRVFARQHIEMGIFLNPPVSFFLGVPVMLTIPDMAFIYDSSLSLWIKIYLYVVYFFSAHKATVITTFSRNSKLDISHILKVDSQKIVVTPLAAPTTVKPQPSRQVAKCLRKFFITKPYLLAVPGTFLPRKNMTDLLTAFATINNQLPTSHRLVIVGIPTGDNYYQTISLVEKLHLSRQVIFTGRINDADLSSIYGGASLFVCTSLYEGFGLTILEAMKCGAPVISYANSSLTEVVGDAGILVHTVADLPQAMLRVLNNPDLQATLKSKGAKHQRLFNWSKVATTIIAHLPKNAN